jgi:hypothetical protein
METAEKHLLTKQVIERLKAKLHPLLMEGWKTWPPTTAEFLSKHTLLHAISFTNKMVCVDGAPQTNNLSTRDKRDVVFQALATQFSPFSPVNRRSLQTRDGTYLLFFSFGYKNNRATVNPKRKPVWLLQFTCLPITNQTNFLIGHCGHSPQISFLAELETWPHYERKQFCVPAPKKPWDSSNPPDTIKIAVPLKDSGEVLLASKEFFRSPTPEHVKRFGDLCLLSQAKRSWRLKTVAPVLNFNNFNLISDGVALFPELVKTLSQTVGFRSLLKTARIQLLLLNDQSCEAAFWRRLLTLAELGGKKHD